MSHSRSGAGRTAQPFLSQLTPERQWRLWSDLPTPWNPTAAVPGLLPAFNKSVPLYVTRRLLRCYPVASRSPAGSSAPAEPPLPQLPVTDPQRLRVAERHVWGQSPGPKPESGSGGPLGCCGSSIVKRNDHQFVRDLVTERANRTRGRPAWRNFIILWSTMEKYWKDEDRPKAPSIPQREPRR